MAVSTYQSPDVVKQDLPIKLQTYRTHTNALNDYNEIYATNKYLERTTSLEKKKLEDIVNELRANLLKLKQDYFIKMRAIEEYKVRSSILQGTMVIVCIIFGLFILFLQMKLGKNLLFIIVSILFILYILIVYLITRSNGYRVETNWNKYYWGPLKKNL